MNAYKLNIYIVSALLVLLSACTRNDGDIGELYGLWRVVSIEDNGEELESYDGTLYFAFQSNVYCQRVVDESLHVYTDNFASWYYQSDDEIIVDFSDNRYAPFTITGMQKGQNLVRIEKCEGKDLEMSYVAADGTYYIYKLKKW